MYYDATIIILLIILLIFYFYHSHLRSYGTVDKISKSNNPVSSTKDKPAKTESSDVPNLTNLENTGNDENTKNAEIRTPGLTTGQDGLPDEDGPADGDIKNPYYDKYKTIPRKIGCTDEYSRCSEWAANGECEANPDFMIQNCQNSCRACGLNQEQKGDLVGYYLNEPLKRCIYRGEPYPPGIRLSVFIPDLYR